MAIFETKIKPDENYPLYTVYVTVSTFHPQSYKVEHGATFSLHVYVRNIILVLYVPVYLPHTTCSVVVWSGTLGNILLWCSPLQSKSACHMHIPV